MKIQPRLATEPSVSDLAQEVFNDLAARSAIVQKVALAMQTFEQHGINERLDEDFWRGLEDLMRANRDDLRRLEDALHASEGARS
jgi:hypothetical protein